jgi:glycosyltransferase involved in cell wall biosynthesis
MRVLELSQFFPPVLGGEERHVLSLARALSARHEVVIGTYGSKHLVEDVDGLEVHRIRPTTAKFLGVYQGDDRHYAPPAPDPAVVSGLRRLIESHRPDVIHAHNWIVHSLLPLRNRTTAPFVLTLHDYSLVCSIKRFMYLDERLCSGPTPRRCLPCVTQHYRPVVGPATYLSLAATRHWKRRALDYVLAVSHSVAERNALSQFGVPWSVVPNFIADDLGDSSTMLPRPSWAPPEGDYWFFAGDLTRDKGVGVLMSAYASLPSDRPPLLLAGRSVDNTTSHLPPGAVVVGPRDHSEVRAAFANAAAATAPSVWPEPCPTVVLEAMAYGAPVVATAVGGIVDIIRDGVDGQLVPARDADALAAALWRLRSDPVGAERMRQAAAERVASFRAESVVSRIEQLYEGLQTLRRSAAQTED